MATYLKLQIDAGIVGNRPICIDTDGHFTAEHKVLALIPPLRRSAGNDSAPARARRSRR